MLKFLQKFFLFPFFLFPFSLLYGWVTSIRNFLYDKGIFKSHSFPTAVISVGNLTVGGTGKTPHVEYLIQYIIKILKKESIENKQVAFLSRGYGRKTKGFLFANHLSKTEISASLIGDEPMLIFSKFAQEISVTVGEKRAEAIPQIIEKEWHTKVIILDDAFQHRAVNRNVNILLSDYYRPFYCDFVLPAGRLRERRAGAKRADIIVVTKCPENLQVFEKEEIKKQINRYAKQGTPIFFTSFRYGKLRSVLGDALVETQKSKLILVTGIANSGALIAKLQQDYTIVKHFQLPDHFAYTTETVSKIKETYQAQKQNCFVLTTEKDKVKLLAFNSLLEGIDFFYIPVEVFFLEKEDVFLKTLQNLSL